MADAVGGSLVSGATALSAGLSRAASRLRPGQGGTASGAHDAEPCSSGDAEASPRDPAGAGGGAVAARASERAPLLSAGLPGSTSPAGAELPGTAAGDGAGAVASSSSSGLSVPDAPHRRRRRAFRLHGLSLKVRPELESTTQGEATRT
jgi:hypothetical protein